MKDNVTVKVFKVFDKFKNKDRFQPGFYYDGIDDKGFWPFLGTAIYENNVYLGKSFVIYDSAEECISYIKENKDKIITFLKKHANEVIFDKDVI